ncbi:MAG: hypothetical protein HGA38_05450 [Candidatus Moranbacteria bacterium]|nr:hypothetical protein [Candidatus Moranbacteria bacterium]NTW46049.1 hypothetical protein [Candidatus Moranbacteria bacterium]
MNEREFQEAVSSTIREILETMGIRDAKIDVYAGSGDREPVMFSVTVDRSDSKVLIGQRGVGLFSFQHLIQTIVRRKYREHADFGIDVNRYWKEKKRHLRHDAEDAAHEAVATGRPIQMRPMSSYERKVVHAVLSASERVETGSVGKGEDRRVVVKPKAVFS